MFAAFIQRGFSLGFIEDIRDNDLYICMIATEPAVAM